MIKSFIVTIFIVFSLISKGQASRQDFLLSYIDTSKGREFYGYKTSKGKVVLPAKYDIVATDTFYAFAFVADRRGWVGINRKDSVILKPFIFDNFPDEEKEGVFRYVQNG